MRFIPLSGITRNQICILVILLVEDLILISHVIFSKLKKKYKVRAKQHRERMPQICKLSFTSNMNPQLLTGKEKRALVPFISLGPQDLSMRLILNVLPPPETTGGRFATTVIIPSVEHTA